MSGSRSPLPAPWWELIGLAALIAVYFVAYNPNDPDTTDLLNIYGPIVCVSLLFASAIRAIFLDPDAIWTALFWFRTSAAIYYGIGNLVPIFADQATVASLMSFYPFDADDIAELNRINTVSCFFVLAASNLFFVLWPSTNADPAASQSGAFSRERQLFYVGMIFLVVGGIFKYLFLVPYTFRLLSFVLPESVTTIANLTYAGIYLLTVWALEYRRSALPPIIGFIIIDIIVGILDLQKYAVLITLILFGLAFLRSKVTLLRLGVVVSSLLLVYVIISPIVEIGRFQFNNQFGVDAPAGFEDRFDIVWGAMTLTQSYIEDDSPGARNGAISRISYTNQSAYAMQQYDNHSPGNSLTNIFAVFIPRILWPNKPIITQIASDFNYAITGNPMSQTSPGLFADAYWDYGWTGVIIAMSLLGPLLAWLSRYALDVLHRGQWVYFPIVLLAMKIGFRTDGYLVADIVGGSVILFASMIILHAIMAFPFQILLRPAAVPGDLSGAPMSAE